MWSIVSSNFQFVSLWKITQKPDNMHLEVQLDSFCFMDSIWCMAAYFKTSHLLVDLLCGGEINQNVLYVIKYNNQKLWRIHSFFNRVHQSYQITPEVRFSFRMLHLFTDILQMFRFWNKYCCRYTRVILWRLHLELLNVMNSGSIY